MVFVLAVLGREAAGFGAFEELRQRQEAGNINVNRHCDIENQLATARGCVPKSTGSVKNWPLTGVMVMYMLHNIFILLIASTLRDGGRVGRIEIASG